MPNDSVMNAIQEQEWLKPVEDSLKGGLDAAFEADTARGKPIENALHGVWLGHPLHPVLTDIPVGAWSVAFVLDLMEAASGKHQFQAGADAAVNIGIVGALGSAVTGITDWKDISKEARRAGLVHGLTNSVALALYAVSAVQRTKGRRGAGRLTSFVGFALAMGSAWLGGHLVYADQIGVKRTPGTTPPSGFVPALAFEELEENKPRLVECEGYPIVLVRKGSRVFAVSDTCSHLGGPLSEGKVEGDCIRCPWHGSLFSLETGEVRESPAAHPVLAFETHVANGKIFLRVQKGKKPSTA